jgi:hypothetical protein
MFLEQQNEEDQLNLYYLDLKKSIDKNYELTTGAYSEIVNLIKSIFDAQQKIFKLYFWMTQADFHKNSLSKKILCAAHLKNMNTIFSNIELTSYGLYGSSRILLRQIFEFLIIAKYSSLTHDEKFIEHWQNGGQIGIGKQVFQKIKIKEFEKIGKFWKILCDFNHATSLSNQIGLKYKYVKDEIVGDFAIILILLNCNYHMLTQHIIDTRMKYYGSYYFSTDNKNDIIKCRNLMKSSRNFISNEGIAIIRFYISKWDFK